MGVGSKRKKYHTAGYTNQHVSLDDLKSIISLKKRDTINNVEKIKDWDSKWELKNKETMVNQSTNLSNNQSTNLSNNQSTIEGKGQLDINSLLGNLDAKVITNTATSPIQLSSNVSISSKRKRRVGIIVILVVLVWVFYVRTTSPLLFQNISQTIQEVLFTDTTTVSDDIKTPLSDSLDDKWSDQHNEPQNYQDVDPSFVNSAKELDSLSTEISHLASQAKVDKDKDVYDATQILLKNIDQLQRNIRTRPDINKKSLESSIKRIKKVFKRLQE